MRISAIYHSPQYLQEIGKKSRAKKRQKKKRKIFVERLQRKLAMQRGKEVFATHMRANPTSLEAKLGFHLNAVIKGRTEIEPQKIISGYIVDFYIPKYRLAFEADGPRHELPLQAKYDEQRDQHLRRVNVFTHRFVTEDFAGPHHLIRSRIKAILNAARIAYLSQPSVKRNIR